MLEKRVALILAASFTALAIIAFVFDWSIAVGKRGIEVADGETAHYLGGFWMVLSLMALASMIADPDRRRQVNLGLTIVLVMSLVGPMIYLLLARP